MRIRAVKKEELDDISELFIETFLKTPQKENWKPENSLELIKYYHKHQKDMFFVATVKSQVVGVIAGIVKPYITGFALTDLIMFVNPKMQKQKIGSKLLKHIAEKSKNKYSVSVIEGLSYTLDTFPIKWYESVGFRKKKFQEYINASVDELINML